MPRHKSGRHGHKGDSVLPRRGSHEEDAQTPVEDSPRGRPAQTHQHGRPHSPQSRRQDKVGRRTVDAGGGAGDYAALIGTWDNDVAKSRRDYELERAIESSSSRPRPRPRLPEGTFRDRLWGQRQGMVARHSESVAADAANPTNNLAAPTPMGSMTTSNAPNHATRLTNVAKADMIYEDGIARARRNKQLERSAQSSLGRTRPNLRLPEAEFGKGPSLAGGIAEPERPAEEPTAQSEGQIVDMGWKEMLGVLEQKVGALEAENRKLQHENDQFRAWLNQAPK